MNSEDIVVNLINLNGDTLRGQTRLQKEAYLLDRSGANFRLKFVYRPYGPYSSDLVYGWTDAKIEGRIEIEEEVGKYGVPCTVFKLKEPVNKPNKFGELKTDIAQSRLKKMGEASEIVLELAAAIVYLQEDGFAEQTIKELKARKSVKAQAALITKARDLLRDLGLKKEAAIEGKSEGKVKSF